MSDHKHFTFVLIALVGTLSGARSARADELAPDVAQELGITPYVDGLELPTATEFLPDGRLVVIEKTGRVFVRLPNGDKILAGQLQVDAEKEKGLLNVIAHPSFAMNHELVFYYSAKDRPELDKHKIALIRLGDDNRLDIAGERVLVQGLRGPDDHEQGGGLAIDSTGHLLVGVGDTGCRARKLPEPPYTPANYFATCLSNGNGKILRIGLDGSIPEDNPLVSTSSATACGDKCGDDPSTRPPVAPRRDIWAWGLRNPWRLWVDPKTGSVWVGDVGDMAYEEIDVIPKAGGLHYGWPWREGAAGHPVSECRKTLPDRGDCVEPAYYCRHDDVNGTVDAGCKSINGGLIIDDCHWPDAFRGRYFFGDNANGRIWSLQPTANRDGIVPSSRKDVGQVTGFVVDMDQGPDAALYLTVMRIPPDSGKVLRLAPRTPRACEGAEAAVPPTAAIEPMRKARTSAEAKVARHRKTKRAVLLGLLALGIAAAAGAYMWDSRKS